IRSPITPTHYAFCYSCTDLLPLHSFPTRRSSDLTTWSISLSWMPASLTTLLNGVLQRSSRSAVSCWNCARVSFSSRCRGPSADADRKSTRLNSSHVKISYAVFCLKKKIELTTLDL